MSRIKDLVSKGVRLIVVEDQPATPQAPAQERDIPAEAFQEPLAAPVTQSAVPADVDDFTAVYDEAGVTLPPHGYGVDKVAEMLQSKRLATLGREVKATAVMAALEAAGAPVRDVIQDGVRRDAALDAFESAKETELRELQRQSAARVQAIKEEIDGFLRAKNAEIEELKQATEGAEKAFASLQTKKRSEEERIHEVVAHFIEGAENPITTGPRPAAPASPPAKPSGS
jgi:glycyl-tRNA synthetase beta subunit